VQHVDFSKVEEPENDRFTRVSGTKLSERSRIQDGPCFKSGKEDKDFADGVSTQKSYCFLDAVASDLLAPGEGSSKLMQKQCASTSQIEAAVGLFCWFLVAFCLDIKLSICTGREFGCPGPMNQRQRQRHARCPSRKRTTFVKR